MQEEQQCPRCGGTAEPDLPPEPGEGVGTTPYRCTQCGHTFEGKTSASDTGS